MKKFPLLLLFLPAMAIAQHKPKDPSEDEIKNTYTAIPKVDGQYEFSEIVQLDSTTTKDILYQRAKLFFANEFKSAKDVLQYDDRGEGKIVGKGYFHLQDAQMVFLAMFSETREVNFTLEIFCKDGRYRYRIYNINSEAITRASGGNTPDNVSRTNQNLDISYAVCQKGPIKKMERRLFAETLAEIQRTISDIKKAMSTLSRSDNF